MNSNLNILLDIEEELIPYSKVRWKKVGRIDISHLYGVQIKPDIIGLATVLLRLHMYVDRALSCRSGIEVDRNFLLEHPSDRKDGIVCLRG